MAYQEHGMWEILDVLERVHRGESRRSIERSSGRSRKTIARYVAVAVDLGWIPQGTHAPDEALATEVFARLRPGPKEVDASAERELQKFHDEIERLIAPHDGFKKGLTLTKIHILLKRQGLSASYSALNRYAHKHLEIGRSRSTVRIADVSPGEVAEVDFGYLGLVPVESGKRRKLHALIVTLVHSRHQYVYVTHEQTHEAFVQGLDEAWEFFGGVPRRVVLDNLKAAVTKADRFEPTFQRTFNEYARYRGFVIDAAVVRHPTGKPHVERQVQYVRENFFRGESWQDRDHVQREVRRWCTDVAGLRVHGTTRRKPFKEFETHERNALLPFDGISFDTPCWAEPKVHPDHHVRFDYGLYSVPHVHQNKPTKGRKVTVRGDSRLVRIYLEGELVKTHPRVSPGTRSTDPNDYPPEKTDYAMRDAERIIARARRHGEAVGAFAEELLAGDFPWARLRQAQKLMRLVERYGAERLEASCRRALNFKLINVTRLENIVRHALDTESKKPAAEGELVQLDLRFLRPPSSFNQQQGVMTMDVQPSLKTVLKRLRLSGIAPTIGDRSVYAKGNKLSYLEFLELVLQDEVDRRDQTRLARRLANARFQESSSLEDFDWDAPITFDRDRVKGLFSLAFLERGEDVIFMGPAGVGKTFLASALGHAACRTNRRVLFVRADDMIRELRQSRADNSTERVLRSYIALDLLIVDDFGLRKLSGEASVDFYEVLIARHKRASTVITSNRTVDEWIALFADPILAQSCLDRLAHNAHQVIIEGESYRKRQGPAAANSYKTVAKEPGTR